MICQTKNEKGITLVALVVTIIVLIIFAVVSINSLLGGIIEKTQQAKQKYINAQIAEEQSLDELEQQLEDYNKGLPENTPENPQKAGTEVKMPLNWYTTTPAYISTEDGSIVRKAVKVASVTAVATGNGETVPVPNGFYYVGGTISSGVVISDNKADKNKYANAENGDIPSGAIYKEDGSAKRIVYDNEGNVTLDEFTAEEKNTAILGNQFVWIPASTSDYVKWGKTEDETWETQTNTAELPQIQKYGGFYIGRYEAGTSNITLSNGANFANPNTASGPAWVNPDFSISYASDISATGKITQKAGEIPYYHTDYYTAFQLSNNMYQTDYVQSGLVTGTMWDAMMKFIADNDVTIVTKDSSWGNYLDGSVTYTAGKGRYATVDSGATSAFTVSDGEYYMGIRTTASSEDVKKKNLYDVAGNLWEWTQEAAYRGTAASYMLRGGCFSAKQPAYTRTSHLAAYTSTHSGFRPALYIK